MDRPSLRRGRSSLKLRPDNFGGTAGGRLRLEKIKDAAFRQPQLRDILDA
jgi:hypothetical protein